MKALVLKSQGNLEIRDVPAPGACGPNDVRIRIHTVGICGSDVHYYTQGRVGPYIVREPMILGHEASGTVIETGANVTNLAVGDRVCMEPGIPDPNSKASRLGIYNVDPAVTFWATPPIDGCLTNEVLHPASFTYRLPDNVTFAQGAMVEPFAVGMQAATKAKLKPGDTVAVTGAGTIGMMIALAALAGGASRVIISDVSAAKLEIAGRYPGIIPFQTGNVLLSHKVAELTNNWGANVVFEASGNVKACSDVMACACPGGAVVIVGIPDNPVPFDVGEAQAKELRFETVFRYANMYDRAVDLIASGMVNFGPLISATFPFEKSVEAFERAAAGQPSDVKLQISFAVV
jgi:D-xylulose reductase